MTGIDVYRRAENHVFVEFQCHYWLAGSWKYYIDHLDAQEDGGYITWRLDYSKASEKIDDSVGFWRVLPVADNAEQTEIHYSVDVILSKWNFMRSIMVKQGRQEATGWVKKQSEQRQAERFAAK